MKSTKDQLIDLIINDYLLDLVSQCSYEAQDSDDEVQAFKDLMWNTIQQRISVVPKQYTDDPSTWPSIK